MDKRVVHATLTTQGETMIQQAPGLQDVFSAAFENWRNGKIMIVASLQRVASMMNAEHIDASPMLHVGIADAPDISASAHDIVDVPAPASRQ